MKKLLILCFVLTGLSINAQEQEKDSVSNWTKKGVFTLLFNQASFSNWIAGGENSVSGTVSINYDFNYKSGDWSWDNKIITKYGISNISGTGTRKTDDFFEFNSLLGKKANNNWSYSFLLNIRSQFTDGFDYTETPKKLTSEFFAPGYVTLGPGMLYKKSDNFNINISPATMKATFVSKDLTANESVFGVDQGKTSRYELGFYASMYYKVDLMQNVSMENIFNVYSNYLEDPQNIDINYQMNFVMQINKYLSTNLNLHMIVDDNATSRMQFKQLFGLGELYFLTNKTSKIGRENYLFTAFFFWYIYPDQSTKMALLLFYAIISIFFSFLCSILEAVLLSVTPTFINVKITEGKSYAKTLEKIKEDVDKPLIAILTLNTIAHTVGAILVGVQAEQLPYKFEILGVNVVGIVSAIMTILILVVSEIIPKTIGATHWKKLAGFTTTVLSGLIFFFKWTGILWILQLFTKLFGKGGHGSVLSREDFTAMTDIAEKEGVFQESESKVIRNLLNFKEVLVRDIMTPRTVLKTANEIQSIQDFFDENPNLRFSRIPIYSENTDNITGYFLKDQLLEAIIKGNGNQPLSEIKRTILVTNRDLPIPNLFEQLIDQREHIALVVDEYGSVSGLVTQEDMIETLLGLEIMDESDNIEDLQLLARKSWERRAKRLGIIDDLDLKE